MLGALREQGNRIVDNNDNPVQLKGMTSNVKSTIVRATMGAQEGTGDYLDDESNRNQAVNQVVTVVDAAIANHMYVIIDWHDEQAIHHTDAARDFFVSMANKYKNIPNVIFEIYKESNGPNWHHGIAYVGSVIGAIRNTGAINLIIVGIPTWSQDVDIASQTPIADYKDIAYTLQFYAGTHRDELRSKFQTTLNNEIALFITEWGDCDASGNGNIDLTELEKWINFMDSNKLSWCKWRSTIKTKVLLH